MTFSFVIPLQYFTQTLSFIHKNQYLINENESDFNLGYITLNIPQSEIPSIRDFLQEVPY